MTEMGQKKNNKNKQTTQPKRANKNIYINP